MLSCLQPPSLPQQPQPQQHSWVVWQAGGCDDSLRPLLDAVLPRELVSGSRGHVQAAAPGSSGMNASGSGSHLGSVGSPFGGTLLPHTLSRQSAGEFSSVGDSAHPSRVTSFDMLSVGNPWGDLQAPNRCSTCGTVVGLRYALLQCTDVLTVQLDSPATDDPNCTNCLPSPFCSDRYVQSTAQKLQPAHSAASSRLPTPFGAAESSQLLGMSPTVRSASQQGAHTQHELR